MLKNLIRGCAFLLLYTNVYAKVELPAILNSNMVLQQKSNANLWGTAKPSAMVTVYTSWNKKKYMVKSGTDGKWKIAVSTPKAGGPYEITFNDGQETKLSNILIGEVWMCAGQSNMQIKLKGFTNQPIANLHDILMEANNNQIRLFTVKTATSTQPEYNCQGDWEVSNIESALNFSAVAYQYGLILQKHLKVPVGLVVSAVGGTPIKAWMDKGSLNEIPEIKLSTNKKLTTKEPTALYNAMIAPLTPLTIKGFLWYQGEADRAQPSLYEREMAAMIKSWRNTWKQGELPFYYVQIAPWLYPGEKEYMGALVREQQLKASQSIPNVGMAVTLDSGSNQTVHPPHKTIVAKRLSYIALAKTYDMPDMPYMGPIYKDIKVSGNKATLTFTHNEQGLYFKDGKTSNNFEIAGEDKIFYPAKATINAKGIVVESDKVNNPVAVRYAFKNYVVGDLYNAYGLPASSFRTDSFPIE